MLAKVEKADFGVAVFYNKLKVGGQSETRLNCSVLRLNFAFPRFHVVVIYGF